ncbi:hypothetical protein SESBI_15734 [Sesbania bispinosa]|nr:hypothetical protein SESBI_15734 [Sesbania bispinosa]
MDNNILVQDAAIPDNELTVELESDSLQRTLLARRSLVGKILSQKLINRGAVKNILAKAWENYVNFDKVSFWLQIHGMPLDVLNTRNAAKIVATFAEVMEVLGAEEKPPKGLDYVQGPSRDTSQAASPSEGHHQNSKAVNQEESQGPQPQFNNMGPTRSKNNTVTQSADMDEVVGDKNCFFMHSVSQGLHTRTGEISPQKVPGCIYTIPSSPPMWASSWPTIAPDDKNNPPHSFGPTNPATKVDFLQGKLRAGLGPEDITKLGLIPEFYGPKEKRILFDYPSPNLGRYEGAKLNKSEIIKCREWIKEGKKESSSTDVLSGDEPADAPLYFVEFPDEEDHDNYNSTKLTSIYEKEETQLIVGWNKSLSLKRRTEKTTSQQINPQNVEYEQVGIKKHKVMEWKQSAEIEGTMGEIQAFLMSDKLMNMAEEAGLTMPHPQP